MAINQMVTNVGNTATGGNRKSNTVGIQVPMATNQAGLGLGDASNRLRGGVFGAALGIQNYGIVPKMGG